MEIGQAITMPLLFTSNATYPITIIHAWVRVITNLNPLSYIADAMRTLFVTVDFYATPLDMGVILSATAVSLLSQFCSSDESLNGMNLLGKGV